MKNADKINLAHEAFDFFMRMFIRRRAERAAMISFHRGGYLSIAGRLTRMRDGHYEDGDMMRRGRHYFDDASASHNRRIEGKYATPRVALRP